MSVRENVQSVPRWIVSGYLSAVRLPLTATERVTRQQGNEEWPPSLAFERFEAGVETLTGSLLRDPALVQKGQLRRAKVAQLRKATELRTLAEQEKQQADTRLRQRRRQVERERSETERRAEQRKAELERQAEAREREVHERAARKAAKARQAKAAQQEVISRRERSTRTQALSAEEQALRVKEDALRAEETVEVLDGSIQASKEARSSG